MKKFLGLLGFLGACTQPVERNTTPVAEPMPPSTSIDAKGNPMPDLKKKIWIMPVLDSDNPPEGLKNIPVGEKLRPLLVQSFADTKGPFISQSDEDEQALLGFKLEAKRDPAEIARFLRGSDFNGFLMASISKLEATESGGGREGLVKSRQMIFTIELSYELYDTMSGKRIVRGKDSQTYVETRSEFLGVGLEIPDLASKVQSMGPELSTKVAKKLSPFADKLAWSGRLLRIDGGRVYINAGRKTGLMVGDVLKVLEPYRDIVDPQNGSFVGTAPGRTKGTVKVIQYFGADGAVAVLQSGGGLAPDDRVELY